MRSHCQQFESMCNHQGFQRGFTLLEVLLVLAISGVLLTVSIRGYRQYQQEGQLAQVRSDLSLLYAGLSQYYFNTGCNSVSVASAAGEFKGDLTPNVSALPLPMFGEALPQSRGPIVQKYEVAIIDTGEKTTAEKHIYQLQVTAKISRDALLGAGKYAQLLRAGSRNGRRLRWTMLPNARPVESSGPLWLLDATRDGFRAYVSQGEDERCPG